MAARYLLTLSIYILTAHSAPCKDNNQHPTATVDLGTLYGTTTVLPSSTVTVNKFLGIPFAEVPVRFEPPEPAATWDAIYDASKYGPACHQSFLGEENSRERKLSMELGNDPTPPPAGESEDCLNLNIYAPASASNSSKAVLFWIYGGGFQGGANSIGIYDGSRFAANQDVVVVSTNYRTNLFGFSSYPGIQPNLGLLDQRLALDWVYRNIANFGGDPKKITLVGESAGAGSVDRLVINPPNPPQFHAAIMQSGSAADDRIGSLYGEANSTKSWQNISALVGCSPSDLKCMRAVKATKLVSLAERNRLNFYSMPDGFANIEKSYELRQKSTEKNPIIARVPIMIGNTAEEAMLLLYDGVTSAKEFLQRYFPGKDEIVNMLLELYPIGDPGIASEQDRISMLLTELSTTCPERLLVDDNIKAGIPTWRYQYNASFTSLELFEGSGVYHASEIPIIFGTFDDKVASNFQRELSNKMQKTWADFAKDPSKGPGWEQSPEVAIFGGGVRNGEDGHGKKTLATVNHDVLDKRCGILRKLQSLGRT